MSTCNQLDLESLLGSWPTIYICPKISSRALVGGEESGIDDGSGIPKGPPMSQVILFHVGFVSVNFKNQAWRQVLWEQAFNNWGLSTCGSYTDDRILSQPSRILQGPPHIFFLLFHPKRCGLHAFGSSHVSRGTFWHWNALVQKLPSEFTVMLLMHLHFADQFFLRQLSFVMFGGQDGAYSTPFSWGEIRPPLR